MVIDLLYDKDTPGHSAIFYCHCGERVEGHTEWVKHFRSLYVELQPMELLALMDAHKVHIVCECAAEFDSPFRFMLHQRGQLEAFDARK